MDELENRGELNTEQETPQATPEPETGQEEVIEQTESTTEEPAASPAEDPTETPQEAPAEEPAEEPLEAKAEAASDTGEETDAPTEEATEEAASEPLPAQSTGGGRLGGGLVTPAVVTPTPALLATGGEEGAEEQESDEEYNTLLVNELDIVKLGRQGEHETQEVVIDCTAWLERLSGCALMIAAIRPGENEIYLPTVDVEDGVITWTIRDTDTARGGWGRGEVRAMLDGKIKKSAVFRTRVEPCLEGSGSTPATPPDWVQEILGAVQAAQEAAESAAANAAQAEMNTRGLAGWSLTKETDGTVTIDYDDESETEG